MRRFAVLLAVSLSAGLAIAQEPADDRTPIPAGIDTWYRVDHNRVHVGWFHEELVTSTMRNYRYAYRVQSEYAYTTQNLAGEEVTHQISEALEANLEEDFDIYELNYTLIDNGVQNLVQLRTYTDSDERIVKVELKSEPPVYREFKFATSETIHLYLNPMLYRLRQNGSLAQPTRLREKAFVPTLDDPVSVSYSAGGLASKEILGKPAKVSEVRIEGWDRGSLAPLTRIWVDKYGRMVEAESADKTITFTMVNDQKAAVGNRPGIHHKNRRDPFSKKDALTPTAKGEREGKGPKEQDPEKVRAQELKIEKDKLDAVMAETRDLVLKLQEELKQGFAEEARATYLRILANYRAMYRHVETDLVRRTEVDKFREDAERLYGGVKRLRDAMVAKVERINDLYLSDNLEGIDRELAELKEMRNAPELFRSEEGVAELESAIRAAETKRNQTVARIELGKKVLILTGTITATEVVQDVVKLDFFVGGTRLGLSQPVSVRRVVTMAVINDEPYREGDIVQREGVKVMKIHRHAVEVEYKGEVRQVVLRKS